MQHTLLAAYSMLWMHIDFEGDGVLPQNQDPFKFDRNYGASILIRSTPGHRLTWSYVKFAVEGMYELLYRKGKYYQVQLEILDRYDGRVGKGSLSRTIVGNITIESQTVASS